MTRATRQRTASRPGSNGVWHIGAVGKLAVPDVRDDETTGSEVIVMRATVMYGAGDVRVEDMPDPAIREPTDAVVRVLRSAICGSDLWPYQSMPAAEPGRPMGHEFLGVIEDTGAEVSGLKRGDLVVTPFVWADNTCAFCREGLHTSCRHGGRYGFGGVGGSQAEAVRVPLARGTLVKLPTGATEVIAERGEEAAARVRELTGGDGTRAVLECVGTMQALQTALGAVRDGGVISRIGVPQYTEGPIAFDMIMRNITLAGGACPAQAYIEELMPDVLDGTVEPGRVFDRTISLDDTPDGYRTMASREVLKVLIRP
jgi:threonine dehydrogenase-like Zn-dependent dehydrogenase